MMVLLIIYLLVACKLLHTWIKSIEKNPDLSYDQKYICWIVLAIATVFWPIVVPISYMEKCAKAERDFNKISINQIKDHLVCDLNR